MTYSNSILYTSIQADKKIKETTFSSQWSNFKILVSIAVSGISGSRAPDNGLGNPNVALWEILKDDLTHRKVLLGAVLHVSAI